jgi:hypothetical protein
MKLHITLADQLELEIAFCVYLILAPSLAAGEDATMDLTVCLSSGLNVSTALASRAAIASNS